ncbi:uncharacterized protein LOC119098278 [Pollicipes pollicipes]|uniref:uncharacterized protein LOC119098278 n=1 Tax=Pollicipes pollicipes TaxID=41117 RepID=UPI001884936C|nr:uncharacterized protein LOC119098278 [Pollicipes pollicipes]
MIFPNGCLTRDRRGRPAQYYLEHPDDLALPTKAEPTRNRQRQRRTPPKDHVRQRKRGDSGATAAAKPGGAPVPHASIRIWIHDRDMDKLEKVVIDGHGEQLLNETAGSARVNKFLVAVRPMMIRIRELHSSAINDDLDKVEAMTEGQKNLLTSKDRRGLTILHKAAALGHESVVQYMLSTVRDLKNEPDNDGRTPLFYAAVSKESSIYDMLVRAGADASLQDKRNKTADHYRKHPQELPIQHVYQLPDAPRNSSDNLGVPEAAGRRRSLSTDRHQGGGGKRSNSRRDRESTTSEPPPSPRLDEKDVTSAQIDTWIRQGDLEKLEQVLVDGHGDSLRGKTAWNEQARGILKAAPAFMEQIAAIHIAAARGDVAEVKELARIKGPHSKSAKLVQSLDEQGRLPLHLAAWYGHTPVIQFLTERYPAGVHILDKDSRAPQHYAAMASDSKKAKKNYNYLIEKGGNDNVKDLRGNTASYYLTNPADESRPPTPEKGAKLRERNRTQDRGRDQDHDRDRDRDQDGGRRSRGQSRHSPRRGSDRGEDADIDMDTVERMLLTGRGEELKGARSKDPDVQELLDSVPYILGKIESAHRAAESGETRDVQAQLDRRKLAGSTLKDGANPLHRAAFMGHAGVVRYLAQNFPDTMEAADRNGRTPLHYAAGSRDGGHCYKLLQRAGAREDATDKRGREPRYYLEHRGALRYTSVDQQTEDYADSEDEADGTVMKPKPVRKKRSEGPQGKEDGGKQGVKGKGKKRSPGSMTTEEGKYLMKEVGGPLTEALKAVSKQKPRDPIKFMADDRGRSILHFAAERSHPSHALGRLLDQSALSLADRDEAYRTARDVAAAAGQHENVAAIDAWLTGLAAAGNTARLEQLLLGGYDRLLGAENADRANILHVAEQEADATTARFLRGVFGFEEKRNWVFAAVRAGSVAHVRQHLDDPRLAVARDCRGRTPLHTAVLGEHADIVRLIASKYPHAVDLGDNMERTPMHYAMGMSQVETIGKILLDAGASRQVKDLGGNTPSFFLTHPELLEGLVEEEREALAAQGPLPSPPSQPQPASAS